MKRVLVDLNLKTKNKKAKNKESDALEYEGSDISLYESSTSIIDEDETDCKNLEMDTTEVIPDDIKDNSFILVNFPKKKSNKLVYEQKVSDSEMSDANSCNSSRRTSSNSSNGNDFFYSENDTTDNSESETNNDVDDKQSQDSNFNGEVFNKWKMNVKRKSRKLLLYKEGTGGRPPSKKELTDLEEQLLQLISKIHLGDHEVMDSFNIEAGTSRIEEDPESSQVIIDLVEDALLVDANQSVEGPTASKQKAFVDSESVPLAIARTIRKKKIGTHRQSADLQNIIKDLVCTHQEKKIEKRKLKLEYYKIFKSFEGFEDFFINI
ncbi:hypothetical protein RN001_008656 [Aquatica leii]|uniref:Uncharacterized protein n=1 Tax=Aquatica leii TaxID=1421715 RepID=A0AAN7P4I9_9COLE|nr:hypothetical protein RN001_008656 [Aquatica leii]